ncbi:hypothetical protein AN477_09400 [Alicyclobacillus ferrooxydans]|uniref:ROK family protein n=1 Tax=Alicyclobacillus ferrooxydans TaxID=471514 RepID=A0A0P9CDT5_9BACL|nr:hypothetical protein AN477_09400 [Alicyclobacillus ferrooxydans]
MLLEVNPVGGYFLAADLTGPSLCFGIVDLSLQVVTMQTSKELCSQGDKLYTQLRDGLLRLQDDCKIKSRNVLGVGVATPGLIGSDGTVLEADNLGWHHFNLREHLEKDLSSLVIVQNDSNAAAYGEFQYNSLHEMRIDNMLYVSVDTGVGSGLVFNGQLYRGARGLAGEVGHIKVSSDGLQCTCGRRGCLETVSSAPGMIRDYQQKSGRLIESFYELAFRANSGDVLAASVIREAAEVTGVVIANHINMLNLDAVVLGGGVCMTSDLFIQVIREYAKDTLPELREGLVVRRSSLGSQAGLIGVASLSINYLFPISSDVLFPRYAATNS